MTESMRVLVEGSIAAGKTTFVARLGDADGVYVHTENVDAAFLAAFYAENSHAFALQTLMAGVRTTTLRLTADVPGVHLLDRSVVGDYAFALTNSALGAMSPTEWRLYTHFVGGTTPAALMSRYSTETTRVLYVRVPASTMHERQRARDGADSIASAYLDAVHAVHELVMAALVADGVPVYAVDADDVDAVSSVEALLALPPLTDIDTTAARARLPELVRERVLAVLSGDQRS